MPLRFYTLPPRQIQHPYLLVNPKNCRELRVRDWEHAIVDCGVELFRNREAKEYPPGFLHYWKGKAKQLSELYNGRIFVTCPDYPDDFNPGQFGDNVEKTLKNVEEFISVDGVNWLVSIQSRYLDRFSFFESCAKLKDLVGDYPRIAVGTVCKTNDLGFIEYCCQIARRFFPHSWIHAFGLTLSALPRVSRYINSWDSMAWTFPRKPGHSCKNSRERVRYFMEYIERVKCTCP
jgi:hypothetical protein